MNDVNFEVNENFEGFLPKTSGCMHDASRKQRNWKPLRYQTFKYIVFVRSYVQKKFHGALANE